jgi:hypothetical protein
VSWQCKLSFTPTHVMDLLDTVADPSDHEEPHVPTRPALAAQLIVEGEARYCLVL